MRWIIHAVGPVYRLPFGVAIEDAGAAEMLQEKDAQLRSAYGAALQTAQELGVKTIAFSLLCAGVFRGQRDLSDILRIGLDSVCAYAYEGLKEVSLVAYTLEERQVLSQVFAEKFGE